MIKNISKAWLTGFFSVLLVLSISQPVMAKKLRAKIRRPRKHMLISDYKFRVKGQVKGAEEGMSFWVCIQEKGNKQWKPQGLLKLSKEGYFEHLVYIVFDGIDERDKPTRLRIGIMKVNDDGKKALDAYISKAFKEDKYPYINLPAGTEILRKRSIKYFAE